MKESSDSSIPNYQYFLLQPLHSQPCRILINDCIVFSLSMTLSTSNQSGSIMTRGLAVGFWSGDKGHKIYHDHAITPKDKTLFLFETIRLLMIFSLRRNCSRQPRINLLPYYPSCGQRCMLLVHIIVDSIRNCPHISAHPLSLCSKTKSLKHYKWISL